MLNKNFQKWLNIQKKENKIKVEVKTLKSLKNWNFNNQLIYHYSRKFFKIIGIEVKSNLEGKNCDQPIIVQNELGILGIIKDKIKDRYLLPDEDYQGMFARVASYFSDNAEHAQRLYNYMSKHWFMPSTPILSKEVQIEDYLFHVF